MWNAGERAVAETQILVQQQTQEQIYIQLNKYLESAERMVKITHDLFKGSIMNRYDKRLWVQWCLSNLKNMEADSITSSNTLGEMIFCVNNSTAPSGMLAGLSNTYNITFNDYYTVFRNFTINKLSHSAYRTGMIN